MAAEPLLIVKPEDLQAVLMLVFEAGAWFAALACLLAFLGYGLGSALVAGWRHWRGRHQRPFAERAKRLEESRLRTFLLFDRICTRNARERARQERVVWPEEVPL